MDNRGELVLNKSGDYDWVCATSLSSNIASPTNTVYHGEKFWGGLSAPEIQQLDYYSMRIYSRQAFTQNPYAKGIVRRLITNEINTGLSPEPIPNEEILGLAEGSLDPWVDDVTARYYIYGKNKHLCDYYKQQTNGALQRQARLEALLGGDALIVLIYDPLTNLPTVKIIPGDKVVTPFGKDPKQGHKITHGVETNSLGRVVAHWVLQDDGKVKRIPAYGEKSGRLISWLIFGTEKRIDEVRGTPLLTIVIQSLQEIDKYRDHAQGQASTASNIALFIKKTQNKPGTLPISNAAVRKDAVTSTGIDGEQRSFTVTKQLPNIVMEELQVGEEPTGFGGQGTDVNFGQFESSIVNGMAWFFEIPPEILILAFTNNYSASQAAINEFKTYLQKFWSIFGETFNSPIYEEWLISEALNGKIEARDLLRDWRNPKAYDLYGARVAVLWHGSVKPSTDLFKLCKGSKLAVDEGWTTNTKESRNIFGTSFKLNVKKLARENEMKVKAWTPIAEFNKKYNIGTSLGIEASAGLTPELRDNLKFELKEEIKEELLEEQENGS